MCVAFLAKYKVIIYCARSGDSSTRFKAHIETVYLDPNDEFLTQAVIHYIGQPK